MSIQKNTSNFLRHANKSFTTILNETINIIKDARALGIYVYLASKPEGWEIIEQEVRNHFNIGRKFYKDSMLYLSSIGLLSKHSIRNEKGQIVKWETTLYSQVIDNHQKYQNQRVVNPQGSERAPINNIYIENKEDINNTPTPQIMPESQITPAQEIVWFSIFWSLYPKKVSKHASMQIWKRHKLESMGESIIEKLKVQVTNDERWLRGFPPNPDTYLRGKRWEDEVTLTQIKTSHTSKPYDPNDISWMYN